MMDNNFNDEKMQMKSDEGEIKFGFDDQLATDYEKKTIEQSDKKSRRKKDKKPRKKRNIKKIIRNSVIAIVLIAIIVCGIIFIPKLIERINRKAAQKKIDQYVAGIEALDLDAAYESFFPMFRDTAKEALFAYGNATSNEEYWDNRRTCYGDDLTISCRQIYENHVSEKSLQDLVYKMYGQEVEIENAYEFAIDMTYKNKKNHESMQFSECVEVAKIKGDWGVVRVSRESAWNNSFYNRDRETVSPVVSPSEFDWTKMPFYYDGQLYNFVDLTYNDLESMGYFAVDGDFEPGNVSGNYKSSRINTWSVDGAQAVVYLCNLSSSPIDVYDCNVYSLRIGDTDGLENYRFALSNGVCMGMTAEEVIEIMGPEYQLGQRDAEHGIYDMSYTNLDNMNQHVRLYFHENRLSRVCLVY